MSAVFPKVESVEDYKALYEQSLNDPEAFWTKIAEAFYWKKKWDGKVTESNFNVADGFIYAKWFEGAQTNLAYNCLDRHIEAGHGDRVAFYWEGNDVSDMYCDYS